MKQSLLDIVIDIANDLDSDEISSISDTTESMQIAQIVKSTYFSMMSSRNWPHLRRAIRLEGTTDLDYPTHMKLLEDVKELSFINYDTRTVDQTSKQFTKMIWVEPDDFLRICNNRRSGNDDVDTIIDPSGIQLLILNNKAPSYYTSFDDTTVVFDSYNKGLEVALQGHKIQASGYVMPTWSHDDDFIPDLPSEAFMGLVEEAKSRASLKLRQVADQKSEQESQRQRRWLSQKSFRVNGGIQYQTYGRRGNGGHRDVTFNRNK